MAPIDRRVKLWAWMVARQGSIGTKSDARVYRRAGPAAGARPLILNFYGGGFVFGDLRLSDWMCSSVAVNVGAVGVEVADHLGA